MTVSIIRKTAFHAWLPSLLLSIFWGSAGLGQEVIPETGAEEIPLAKNEPAAALSPEERQKLIASLREAYLKPPAEWPKPDLDPGRPHRELGLVEQTAPAPADNPSSTEKSRLGLSLFFDVRLSGQQQISCASCHEPQLGWSNGVTFSFGVGRKLLKRHPPSLIGVGQHSVFFWDGRAASLEAQAYDVILNPDEMAGTADEVVRRLEIEKEFYPPLFEKAFGDAKITFPRVLQAIAAFERTIHVGHSRFDSFLRGKAELTGSELAGLHLFRTKARCINCHMGPMFTDEEFHNLGLTYYGRRLQDLGRYEHTHLPEDVGKFRTPTLRNIDRTAPYMHNGVFPILEGVLRLYNAGMAHPKPKDHQKDDPLFPKTSDLLRPLKLSTQELADLRAFLSTLTEPASRVLFPPTPPLGGTTPAVQSKAD
jgi:cytochrome c peroxidase